MTDTAHVNTLRPGRVGRTNPPGVMGRPTDRTPEVVAQLRDAFKVGSPVAIACLHAGIDGATFYRWMQSDPQFRDEMTRARGGSAVRNLALIAQAASQDWRAAEAHLKLAFPQYFAKAALEVSGPDGGSIDVNVTLRLDDDGRR